MARSSTGQMIRRAHATIRPMRALSAETRARDLALMAEETLDVLVVGGGITGAGVALDAVSRGLRVGLVEREDIASGTSGRSSRLIHGGPRYLQRAELGLVRESLRERAILMRLAPHLVRPLPFLFPVSRWHHRLMAAAALGLYHALSAGRGHRHQWADRAEADRLAPGRRRATGGYVYWDCRTDDARLTLEVVRAAASFGARVATRAEVVGLLGSGRVTGARVRDRLTGADLDVGARVIVNATGAWADGVRGLATPSRPRLRPSIGIHVVLDRRRLPIRAAVLLPWVADRRALLLAIPWGPRVYVGPTDSAYRGSLDEPVADRQDVASVLASVESFFDLDHGDVLATWAGIRPLLDTGRGPTRDLSRRHLVVEDPPGLVTVTGGKLTTYRAMAEDVVDRGCRLLRAGGACRTTRIPLGLTRPLVAELARAGLETERLGLDPQVAQRLVERYGDDWPEAVRAIGDDGALGEPVIPGLPVLRVELGLARERELALSDEDVLIRRTRLSTMDAAAAERLGLVTSARGKGDRRWSARSAGPRTSDEGR
jgi:glycerol-3-phosphate dehydrogenase